MTTYRFGELLTDYQNATATTWPRAFREQSADRLPLSAARERYRNRTPEHGPDWVRASWQASVEDAARELHNLVTIHDNGGTASSPKKIKKAARDLLRLLGED